MSEEDGKKRESLRQRADAIKPYRCKNLIAVLEDPKDIANTGSVIRNVNALGAEKLYIVDPRRMLPDDWQAMRDRRSLIATSASAVKWSFVRRFDSTEACLAHLARKGFVSIVTSPHIKGKANVTLDQADFTQYPKLAIWFGNESRGISDMAVQNSVLCVNIPMFGIIESLNLGTTSGIVLYEAARQRREFQRRYWERKMQRKAIRSDSSKVVLPGFPTF